ncbi:syndecan-2-B [Kryptolebias marmoratus]|uniref:Syndecan n=1 Tax=Kryptolebias marmoratus TaxID=37003 RepID=A0A3Q3B624_KRYMA|nr:syndecan-2-B [Kryptolebias marmoratus]
MKNLWLFFLAVLSVGSISEKLFVLSDPEMADDLYIEDLPSGDSPIDDEDGDDDGSGSGSGDYAIHDDFKDIRTINFPRVFVPSNILPTTEPPHTSPTTAAGGPGPARSAEVTESSLFEDSDVAKEMPGMDLTSNNIIDAITTTTPFSISASSESNWDDTSSNNYAYEDKLAKEIDNILMAEGEQRGRMNEISSTEGVTSENLWDRTDVLAAVIACGVVGFLCAVSLLLLLAYRMKKKDEGSYDLGDIKLSATAYHKAPTKEFYA